MKSQRDGKKVNPTDDTNAEASFDEIVPLLDNAQTEATEALPDEIPVAPPSRRHKIARVIDKTSQGSYVAGAPLNMVYACDAFMSADANNIVSISWNYVEGFSSILAGALMILQENHPHRTQVQALGATSIMTGLLQSVFTYQNFFANAALSGTALGNPVFALGALVDAIVAGINLHYAAKKTTFNGWLEETLLEIAQIDKNISNAKEKSARTILINQRNALLQQVNVRSKVHLDQTSNPAEKAQYRQEIDAMLTQTINNLSPTTETNNSRALLRGIKENYHQESVSGDDRHLSRDIQHKLNERLSQSKYLFAVKLISFVGMTLVAVSGFTCPPTLFIGLALACAVALYYMKHNAPSCNSKHGLFSKTKAPEKRDETPAVEMTLLKMPLL